MSPNAISTGTQAKQDDCIVGLEQYGLQQPSAQQKITPLDMNMPRLYGIRLVPVLPIDLWCG
jgi:trichothecene 3-O-acetyltransferase